MTDRITLSLWEPVQAKQAVNAAWQHIKGWLGAGGERLVLTVGTETRRSNHNRHFHSLIGQISAQIGGDLADAEDAKRILISAFRIDTRNEPDLKEEWENFGDVRMGRGLRGEVVLMGIQSRDFTIKLARAFIEWLYAFGADHDVQFKAWEGME